MLRDLSEQERTLIELVLRRIPGTIGKALRQQLRGTRAIGTSPIQFNLVVQENESRTSVADGPLSVNTSAYDSDGQLEGEILVWATDGKLSYLEYVWYSEDPPTQLPPLEHFVID